MSLKDKYIKKACRFLKENKYYTKEILNEMFMGIELDKDLPHLYYLGEEAIRNDYLNFIKKDFINDILFVLNDRLNLVNFTNFEFHGLHFKNKEEFIYHLVQHFYIESGSVRLDIYLRNINNPNEISSVKLLREKFC